MKLPLSLKVLFYLSQKRKTITKGSHEGFRSTVSHRLMDNDNVSPVLEDREDGWRKVCVWNEVRGNREHCVTDGKTRYPLSE